MTNKVFDRTLRHPEDGVNEAANLHLVVSANVDEDDSAPGLPSISPNLADPVDAAVAFNVAKDDLTVDEA